MSPRLITIFGGTGFIGRRLVARLTSPDGGEARRIRVATRHADTSGLRQPGGEASRIEAIDASVLDDRGVAAAVEGADAVVNLVGILSERGSQTFEAVHVGGARRVAEAVRRSGAQRLVHMSALGADAASPSKYARTKSAGEIVVRESFPKATLVRPSIVFGPGDHFFERFARIARISPALPLIGGGRTRFRPVFVDDVAEAITAMLGHSESQGKTYELAGPREFTFRGLMKLMLAQVGRRRLLIPIPFAIAEAQGALLGLLPSPPLTRDQVLLLKADNIPGGHEPTFETLGVEPRSPEAVLPSYLQR